MAMYLSARNVDMHRLVDLIAYALLAAEIVVVAWVILWLRLGPADPIHVTEKANPNLQLFSVLASGMNDSRRSGWIIDCTGPVSPTPKECIQDAATQGYAPNCTGC